MVASDTAAEMSYVASRTVQRLDDVDGRAGLARLPFSRDEARAIGLLAGAGSLRATDFQATRATVLGSALEDYRIVHFATHGLIDAERPELSGLVLSLVNDRGAPQDGLLRLHDIFNMRLNADLVVLSACQTALGKEIKGEGLVGLTRGFMYAGAPRVVASLWQVSDVATAELMKKFYTEHAAATTARGGRVAGRAARAGQGPAVGLSVFLGGVRPAGRLEVVASHTSPRHPLRPPCCRLDGRIVSGRAGISCPFPGGAFRSRPQHHALLPFSSFSQRSPSS